MPNVEINKLRENVFFGVLLLYVSFLPFSEAFVSISAGLLLFQALVLSSWKHPSIKAKNLASLVMLTSIFGVYLLGLIKTEDLSFGIYELRKVIFWIVLPPAFFLSPRLSEKRFYIVLLLFSFAVFTASAIAFIRLVFSDYFQINGFREITIISHIRFSFQVVLTIIILTVLLMFRNKLAYKINTVILISLLLWFSFFLILLKSLTGILAFIGTAIIITVFFVTKIKSKIKRGIAAAFLVVVFACPVLYVIYVWNDFYNIEKLDPQKVEKFTASGNPYYFDFSSTEKENGNWVKAYISDKELREEWNKRSEAKYDSIDRNGYPYSATLIRYLTSKGLRKDSAGVSKLTEEDIHAIQNGVANHIFIDRGFSIYPRVYQTIWELDRYFTSGNPNYQSVSQRIEFFKASLLLIRKHPWFGIGTGNWKIKYAAAYNEMNSKLQPENQGPAHNQYLNYMVKFGIVGFIFIFALLIIPVFLEGNRRNLLFWLFFASYSIANFGDANFETHMGLSFFCFFYCLFLWHSPEKFKSFPI